MRFFCQMYRGSQMRKNNKIRAFCCSVKKTYRLVSLWGFYLSNNSSMETSRTCASPYNSISVTVRCISSIRDMEPRQIYTARVSSLSERACWLMPFAILNWRIFFPTIFISFPSIIRAISFFSLLCSLDIGQH